MIPESIVGAVALGHLLVAPFTKVEESFNLQACHDILYHGPYISQYDHLDYPGVVPRSFLGPLFVSGIALPFVTVAKLLGISKFYSQYIVRMVLGFLVVLAWRQFYGQVKKSFGIGVAVWYTAITVTQFHFMYYLTRSLPNTFALVFALLAFSYWLEQDHWKLILTSGIGVIVFRMELMLLLGPMLLHDVYTNRLRWTSLLLSVLGVGTSLLLLTVAVDSAFWRRPLWPEGEVFWFNTVSNQSHLWGTLPLLWYWYSALPRALGASCVLVPVALYVDSRMRLLAGPALFFIGLFSLLPHKELRFILCALPLLNVAAAAACQFLYRRFRRNTLWSALFYFAALHPLLNCVLSALLLTVSAANYPGGSALVRLHQLVPASTRVSVHVCNLAAQSGVTRFLELRENWIYNKTEGMRAGSPDLRSFSHLIVEAKTKYAYNLKHYSDSHNIMSAVEAFSHLSFNYQHFPPVKIRSKPAIFLLENLIDEDIRWPEDIVPSDDAEVELPQEQHDELELVLETEKNVEAASPAGKDSTYSTDAAVEAQLRGGDGKGKKSNKKSKKKTTGDEDRGGGANFDDAPVQTNHEELQDEGSETSNKSEKLLGENKKKSFKQNKKTDNKLDREVNYDQINTNSNKDSAKNVSDSNNLISIELPRTASNRKGTSKKTKKSDAHSDDVVQEGLEETSTSVNSDSHSSTQSDGKIPREEDLSVSPNA